jgi:ribonuclease HI
MYFDGSKRVQGVGAGVVLISPQGDKLKYVLRMSFPQDSNNEAKYEALLHGMKMAKACGATRLKIFGDSNLVVQQVMNRCDAISDNMMAYRNLYYYLEETFDGCEVSHISRASNEEADNLANIGSQCLPIPRGVFFGGNHQEVNKRQQKFNSRGTKSASDDRLGGWQARNRKHSRTRGSHDDRRNLDAAMLSVHAEQDTTQRYSRSTKDNTTIQSFCYTTREVIQEKYNWRIAAMRHPPIRARHIKRHPCRSLWTSC